MRQSDIFLQKSNNIFYLVKFEKSLFSLRYSFEMPFRCVRDSSKTKIDIFAKYFVVEFVKKSIEMNTSPSESINQKISGSNSLNSSYEMGFIKEEAVLFEFPFTRRIFTFTDSYAKSIFRQQVFD